MYEYNMKMSCLEDENPKFYKKKELRKQLS